MIRILITAAALVLSAGVAHADQFRIGAGNVSTDFDLEHDQPYFDTYPGHFCGTKAVRIQVLDHNNGGSVRIGRVYFAWEVPGEKGPFRAYTKVNTSLSEGETTAWIQLPAYGCLKKVRVYAEGSRHGGWDYGGSHRVVVIGRN